MENTPENDEGLSEKNLKEVYLLKEFTINCEDLKENSDLNMSIQSNNSDVNMVKTPRTSLRKSEKIKKDAEREALRKKKEDEKLKKEEEKLRKEEEKLRKEEEKKQRELEKEEEKKRKEEEKRLKDLEREEERKKKDDEKRQKEEERKRKEEERRMKEIEREEERKRKEEEKRVRELAREEEKKKREEERKKKEEEKRKEEEEKNRSLEKQRAILMNFLKLDKNEAEDKSKHDVFQQIGPFKPFEIKMDMKIANYERREGSIITDIGELSRFPSNYAFSLNRKCPETWPQVNNCVDTNSAINTYFPVKVIYFEENVRPGYCGTWNKTSNIITGINPLAEDTENIDYEVDSDADWEYVSGEDIGASEDEEEEDVNEVSEEEDYIVPHGYLSDGEDYSDVDPEEIERRNNTLLPLTPEDRHKLIEIKEKQFQAERKSIVHIIDPNCIGPYFDDDESTINFQPLLEPFKMICRSSEGIPITCNLQSTVEVPSGTSSTKVKKSVPKEAIPFLIRLLHGNRMSRLKISYEFRMFWEKHLTGKVPDVPFTDDLQGKDWDEFSIGKKRLLNKIKDIAERKQGKWTVKPEVIDEYQLCCENDDPQNPCLENWVYISGVNKVDISISKIQKDIKKRDALAN